MGEYRTYTILPHHDLVWICDRVRSVPVGEVIVAGTYRGGDVMALIAHAPNRRYTVLDSFAGLPDTIGDGTVHVEGEFNAGGLDRYRRNFIEAGCRLPDEIHEVWINENISILPRPVAFAWLDLDLFMPTLAMIKMVIPWLVPGGVIATHDLDWAETPGIRQAVDESGLEWQRAGYIGFHTR